jgi:hypothetical protein
MKIIFVHFVRDLFGPFHLFDCLIAVDWHDNTRDMLNFMLNYLPDSLEELPVHLPRVPSHVSESRKEHGFDNRTLVGLGHSFCGNSV